MRAGRTRRGAQPLTSQYPPGRPGSLQTLAPSSSPGRAAALPPPPPSARGMSLLTNYEGLRHQIERLVRENEELKKLVRLLRENHELKAAIKTQAGGLGIGGFPGGLGEVATGPSQCQGNLRRPKFKESGKGGGDSVCWGLGVQGQGCRQ